MTVNRLAITFRVVHERLDRDKLFRNIGCHFNWYRITTYLVEKL